MTQPLIRTGLIFESAPATACHFAMADDDQDIFDSLEREASEFTKVRYFNHLLWASANANPRMRRSTAFAKPSLWIRKSPSISPDLVLTHYQTATPC
jgi:hypothetical protein